MPTEISKPSELRDWEDVQTNDTDKTERLRVQGGWLYRTVVQQTGVALVFVPAYGTETK